MGILIVFFILFFQITDLAKVSGIPRIPILGIGALPALIALGTGVSLTNGVLRSPLRRYLKKPDDFLVLKGIVKSAEKTKAGKAVILTIRCDAPDGLGPARMECRQKVKVKFWDGNASLPREARIVRLARNGGETALLAVMAK